MSASLGLSASSHQPNSSIPHPTNPFSPNQPDPLQPSPDNNDPAVMRNLFADGSSDISDPFSDGLDIVGELGLIRPLDAVKFLMSHFRIDQLDLELFRRLKSRAFTIPHAVEQIIKDDAYFRSMLLQFYKVLANESGLVLRAAYEDFRSDAIMSQTCVLELADLFVVYCIYRAGNVKDTGVPPHVIFQTQELTEMIFRIDRCDLLTFVQQCRDGLARFENADLLTGAALEDTPGRLFIQDPIIRPKYVQILGLCHSLYLTSSSALLCDISVLISRLVVGKVLVHDMKQLLVKGQLERIEFWLARRRPIVNDLRSACEMLNRIQEMPGESVLIADTITYALHPVFSATLRSVVILNRVPRNLLTWSAFESLLSDAQLQLDADPDAVAEALKIHMVTTAQNLPQIQMFPAAQLAASPVQQPAALPANPIPDSRKKNEDITVNLRMLPPPPATFPSRIEDAYDVVISCRDCPNRFSFNVSEQDYYIKTMTRPDSGPNFPARCNSCRLIKKQRNNDPLSRHNAGLAIEADFSPDGWDEGAPEDPDEFDFNNL